MPKINISYNDNNILINKQFDLDINTMTKLNKLRRSFDKKDIIKYCLIFIKGKNNNKNIYGRLSSIKKLNSKAEISPKKVNSKMLGKISLKNCNIDNLKNCWKNQDEGIIDIKLNLNENTFNFDKDILKYIKVDEEKKNNTRYNEDIKLDLQAKEKFSFEDNQDKKLNIEIEKIQLFWINSNNIKNVYRFEEDEGEYLFDHSSNIWRQYIEKNFYKIVSNSISDGVPVSFSVKNSNSSIRYNKKIINNIN